MTPRHGIETEYYLPELTTRLPCRRHPEHAQTGRETRSWIRGFPEIEEWALRCQGVPGRAGVDRWLDEGIADVWPSYVFTVGDRKRLRILFDLTAWMIMFDDIQTVRGPFRDADRATQVAALDHAIAVFRGDGRPYVRDEPCGLLDTLSLARPAADAWYRFVGTAPEGIRVRGETAMCETLEAWKEETSIRASGGPADLADFLEKRPRYFGSDTSVASLEFQLGTDLTPEQTAHAAEFHGLRQAVGYYLSLVNDLYSFRHEYVTGQDTTNAITVLCATRGMSVTESVDIVASMVESAEEDFLRLRASFIAAHPGLRPEARAYLEHLGDLLSGTALFSRTSPRYHGVGHDWSDIGHGTVVVDDKRTIIRPGWPASEGEGQ